jgi:hypothetical protein
MKISWAGPVRVADEMHGASEVGRREIRCRREWYRYVTCSVCILQTPSPLPSRASLLRAVFTPFHDPTNRHYSVLRPSTSTKLRSSSTLSNPHSLSSPLATNRKSGSVHTRYDGDIRHRNRGRGNGNAVDVDMDVADVPRSTQEWLKNGRSE